MDRGIWQATVHGVAEERTQLSNKTTKYMVLEGLIYGCSLMFTHDYFLHIIGGITVYIILNQKNFIGV